MLYSFQNKLNWNSTISRVSIQFLFLLLNSVKLHLMLLFIKQSHSHRVSSYCLSIFLSPLCTWALRETYNECFSTVHSGYFWVVGFRVMCCFPFTIFCIVYIFNDEHKSPVKTYHYHSKMNTYNMTLPFGLSNWVWVNFFFFKWPNILKYLWGKHHSKTASSL